MIKTKSLPTALPHRGFLAFLIGAIILASVYLLLASLSMLYSRYADRLLRLSPVVPPSPVLKASPRTAQMPSPTPTAQVTAVPTAIPAADLPPSATPEAGTVRKMDSAGLSAVYIPAGHFRMGDPRGNGGNDSPVHLVELSAYWISRTQVTNVQYARCMEAGGCSKPIRKEINPHYYNEKYANHPVVYITWEQAQTFCTWAGGSLPTEAQWERAAGRGPYPWGDGEPASYFTNINHPKRGTVEVGKYPRNASRFGVLDMGSNVREWVADWYGQRYYRVSPRADPSGPESGKLRVLRGAAWYDPNDFSHIWHRLAHEPGSAGANRGFRCAFPP